MEAFAPAAALAPATLPAALASTSNIRTLRIASAGYASAPGDTPASTAWTPRLLGDIEIGQTAVDALGLGGRAALAAAAIEVWDGDGFAADLARYGTATGRAVALRLAEVRAPRASDLGTPLAQARLVFAGTVAAVDRTERQRARIALADATDRLNTPLQPILYQGTGGLEGGADLKGKPKPVALGRIFNAAPVFLGNLDLGAGALPTWQSSWRAVQAHDAVRIRGVAQTLVAGTPTVGQARDWPAQGCFQIGASPDGDVTCDVRGDAGEGYVETTAGVLRRLVQTLGPDFGAAEFDADAWTLADADLPGLIGFYQAATPTTALAAAATVLAGCGAILAGDRTGRLRLSDPLARDPIPQFDIPAAWIVECRPLALPAAFQPPPRVVEVGWGRNWSPLSNMAGSVPAADRQRLEAAQSVARAESALVTSRVAQQRSLALPGLYATEAAAAARAGRWRDWIERGPRLVAVTTDRYLGQIEIGQIGRIAYPAYGLDAGISGVVVGWREALAGRRVEIILAGSD
jgi:hypothetical protein